MLQNAYLLAKIGADTAENERSFAEILQPGSSSAIWAIAWEALCAIAGRWLLSLSTTAPLSKIGNFAIFFAKFANFWRARSRLYQNEILQENMRLTTFFKLFKICIFLHRCNLKIFAKNRFEKTAILAVKFQQKNCKCRKICKILSNFKISA